MGLAKGQEGSEEAGLGGTSRSTEPIGSINYYVKGTLSSTK